MGTLLNDINNQQHTSKTSIVVTRVDTALAFKTGIVFIVKIFLSVHNDAEQLIVDRLYGHFIVVIRVCHERPLTRYIEQKVFESIQTARSLMLISNHFPMRLFAFEIKGSLLSFVMISVHYSFHVSLFYLLRGINKPLID